MVKTTIKETTTRTTTFKKIAVTVSKKLLVLAFETVVVACRTGSFMVMMLPIITTITTITIITTTIITITTTIITITIIQNQKGNSNKQPME